ncbi:putative glycosyltransferase EpsJ [Elizabethkingia miricola]|nr:putative glycosyltransferase EpsJ [Elizabethkingia miricola]
MICKLDNCLVSVIIPCYNQGIFLEECLNSVINQDYKNLEVIIINDGSDDSTKYIAENYCAKDTRLKLINLEEHKGVSVARNIGLKQTKGEWIQFLDSDDMLEEYKLRESSKYFEENVDVIISGYRYFESDEGFEKTRILGRSDFLPEVFIDKNDKTDVKKLFFLKNPFVISAPLFHSKIFKKIGGFNETLTGLEDWELHLRCALNDFVFHHFGYKEKSKTLIRLHHNSAMRNVKMMDRNLILFKKIIQAYPEYEMLGIKAENYRRLTFKAFLFSLIPPLFVKLYRKFFLKES